MNNIYVIKAHSSSYDYYGKLVSAAKSKEDAKAAIERYKRKPAYRGYVFFYECLNIVGESE